jgi:UDP-N-acetylmuramoyl-tripeptide--D-alanyl-D-alanine ligase
MQWISLAAALLSFIVFARARLLRYLHIFQQEEYNTRRFIKWIWLTKSFDKRVSLIIALVAVVADLFPGAGWFTASASVLAIVFLGAALLEADPRKAAKKRLILTNRAKRIFGVALLVSAGAGGVAALSESTFAWLIAVQLIPFFLLIANYVLWPIEARIQLVFKQEARAIMDEVAPTIVGVTGSFGKTSVKHILGHVLKMNSRALFTPGSVNTVMGISRFIRERLVRGCRYFVVEMGAYGPGSIGKLCSFTPPHHGIITSIGPAHYERFKSLEMVAKAKFELADAVVATQGKLVVDDQVLDQPYAREYVSKHRGHFITVGTNSDSDIWIRTIRQSAEGLDVTICVDGQFVHLFAPLFGEHHGRNMALAFGMARELGISPDNIVMALRTVPQIDHRLEIRRDSSGVMYIDDAYNSNPTGFENALNLLADLPAADGRKILVTPGIVELGAKHDVIHADLGAKAANIVDIALVVRGDRIPTFIRSFNDRSNGPQLIEFHSFAEANMWLEKNLTPNDIVLLENDLPDLYESKLLI